jgi:uncharacterized protein (TIGR00725 family)
MVVEIPKFHLKPKIVISGAAEASHCGPEAPRLAAEVGREVARRGCVLVTGATTGAPYWAAKGAKEAGGFVIGLSPAISVREHMLKYRLPIDYHDIIIYTGSGYAGRNLLLTRVGDGIISVCGRMGTLNEFTIAFEERKPIGVLEGPWESDDLIKAMVAKSHRGPGKIVYSSNPKNLVERLLTLIEKEQVRNHRQLLRRDAKKPLWGGD